MHKTFIKNLLRDIRKTLSRYLSIITIIAVGVAFYAGVRATSPSMKNSGDQYFKDNKLMDYKLMSTMGITEDDVEEFKKQKGVQEAEGAYSIDAVIEKDDHLTVVNVNSLPLENGINQMDIVEGRRPESSNEAIVEAKFLKDNKYKIGDKITLKYDNGEDIKDSLHNNEFTIVGTSISPLYISQQRQLSSVGNGSVRGFVYILPEVFKSEFFTEMYIKADKKESDNSLLKNKEYKKVSDKMENELKELSALRAEVRYDEIMKSANDKIKEAEDKLSSSKADAENKFAKAYEDLKAAGDQLELAKGMGLPVSQQVEDAIKENTAKLKSEEEKANKEFKDAEEKISESREKLKDIKKPEWYVLGRSANVGYETYRQDSDRINNIGKVFPFIFFLVAALVSLTTMTRMVQENRIEIGIFKALGYSRLSVISHYLIYSLSASLIGSFIGISFGFRLFPSLIMNAYSTLYTMPETFAMFDSNIAFSASLLAIFFTTMAAVGATADELRETPASLLRPKPPKSGKKIFLEKIPFIWRRLSFTTKVTARNIFRYKQRFFMTVIGIAACSGLMIAGFGLKGGILGATEKQFNEIYKYNMLSSLSKNMNDEEKTELSEKIKQDQNIKGLLFTYKKNSTVKKEDGSNEDAFIVVTEDKSAFSDYINLKMKNNTLSLNDEGVIITEKFSKLIGKKAGDSFDITINDRVVNVKVSAVTEHYVQHFIYMDWVYYEEITGEKAVYNSFYGLLNDIGNEAENSTLNSLRSIGDITSISFKKDTKIDFGKTVKSIDSVVFILIVSAGILAFVVIYNLTNININERKRELATIKLLGFYNNELAAYIYRENVILTVIGSLLGIFVGLLINNFVIVTAETNIMMFLRYIAPVNFLYSIALTILFSIIVNLAMYKRFDRIDMIESLKSAE